MLEAIFLAAGAGLLGLAYFYRDPEREVPEHHVIVSPADGRVRLIECDGDRANIGIFLNLQNVHVQRVPYTGNVTSISKVSGPNFPAFLKRAKHNKKMITELTTDIGDITIKQMTGLIVRRIKNYLTEGKDVQTGDRLGRIAFGSRVDISFPLTKTRILVRPGQKIKAGETAIAEVL